MRADRGLSLIEALVALAVFFFAAYAALVLYDDVWHRFKIGENAIEQQQAVRIAFGKLEADLLLAGFNHNIDGDAARPDEQLEAAFDTAIVLRADFDADDPTLAGTPEGALAGGAFDAVSVGNDEIVAYVLAKTDGSSTGTLSFEVDVMEVPRDGTVETVVIPGVALIQNDPPYGLYRITLNSDVSTWGTSAFFVRTLVVENVFSMSFRYLDRLGNQLNSTFNLASVADDIGGGDAAAQVAQRGNTSVVRIDLVGLTRDPERDWFDPNDSNPKTLAFRKFQLVGDVSVRNRGMIAIKDPPPI